MKKARKNDLRKFHKWTEARRRNFYLLEDVQKEKVPVLAEFRGVSVRKSPMARYLQGLFAILLCLAASPLGEKVAHTPVNILLQLVFPALVMLYGYNLSQLARDNGAYLYRRRFRRKVLFPMLTFFGVPYVTGYAFYVIIGLLTGRYTFRWHSLFEGFFIGNFGTYGYFGSVMIQLLFVFPILWHFISSKRKGESTQALFVVAVIAAGYEMVVDRISFPTVLYRGFFMTYIIPFVLGMYLFVRRKRKIPLIAVIGAGLFGLLYLGGMHLIIMREGGFPDWMPVFQKAPYASPVACMLLFALFYPFLTRWRYFQLVKGTHWVVSMPGKAYYYIIMAQTFYFGWGIRLSVGGKALEPQGLFGAVICVLAGILWYLLLRTAAFRWAINLLTAIENKTIKMGFYVRRTTLLLWCRWRIHRYNRKLKVDDQEEYEE